MNWIELKKELPKYEEEVLLLCKIFTEAGTKDGYCKPFIRMGIRDNTNKRGENFKIYGDVRIFNSNDGLQKVTHWMPLPKLL